MIKLTSERLRRLLVDEIRQCSEEGLEVAPVERDLARAAGDRQRLLALFGQCARLERRSDFAFEEPSDLAEIRAARPADRPPAPQLPADLEDRILGGWLGRCAGVMLGKPFEVPVFGSEQGAVRRYLEIAGAYPLSDYPPNDPVACAAVGLKTLPCPACHRGNVRHVEPDDDIHYTIAGLEILEQRGLDFTVADVARWWTHRLPAAFLFTAEEAAYRNLMLLGAHHEPHALAPADWEQVRSWLNPYREWIGAQIRADGWALACPGRPELAAELAWRDASLSHVKNGLYGAMYCAALIAAAAGEPQPAESGLASPVDRIVNLVEAGLAQIPARSRLADAVQRTLTQCRAVDFDAARFEELIGWLWREFGHYDPVHTINNAAAVTAALLLGGGDFERTITIAVMCGWDTDCNAATAGCICGAFRGAAALPAKWVAPLNDTLRLGLDGYNPAAISACARRHAAVARTLAPQSSPLDSQSSPLEPPAGMMLAPCPNSSPLPLVCTSAGP